MKKILTSVLVALNATLAGPLLAQVPGIITYQGSIASEDTPFTGKGQFKFALISPPERLVTTYWSNDGTSIAGSEPSRFVDIEVIEGIFTVGLGDVTLPNMLEIPASVFNHADVRLRIWFHDGVSGFAQLTPDQRITSVGYAFRAAGMLDGAVSSTMLAPDSVDSSHIINGQVASEDLANGAVTTAKLANGAVTAEKLAPDALAGAQWPDNSIGSQAVADILNLRELTLENSDGANRLELSGSGLSGTLRMNHGQVGRVLETYGTTDGGYLKLFDKLGGELTGQTTVELGSSPLGGYARLYQDTGGAGVQINGQNGSEPGGMILLYRSSGLGVTLLGQNANGGGEVSVRNASGAETVEIVGAEANNPGGQIAIKRQNGAAGLVFDGQLGSGGGQISVRNGLGQETVEILGNETGDNQGGQVALNRVDGKSGVVVDGQFGTGGGDVRVFNAAGNLTVRLQGTEGDGAGDGAGQVRLYQPDGDTGVFLDAQAGNQGAQLVLNNVAGQTRVNIVGQQESGGGYIGVRDASGTVTAQISGAEVGSQGAQIALARSNGIKTILLDAQLGTGGGSIRIAKSDGSVPIKLDASASGGGRITTQVLEITGGSDLSEKFDIAGHGFSPEPGMVACIDAANPGRLIASSRAYDATVAGVISGAGGVQTGMIMGQNGSVADGRYPVALTGRVYCLVDAEFGAVQPGDLLTTSDTPGHAMKVADPARAAGAIIGKAMTSLDSGRGLVLVLVSLQ